MTCRFPAWRRFRSCVVALMVLHEGVVAVAADTAVVHMAFQRVASTAKQAAQLPPDRLDSTSLITRVRSEEPRIAAAIVHAINDSPTFRSMVETIQGTDGIVYVREGVCRFRLRACLAGVHNAPPVRFVYIKIDTRRAVGCELMASLGHELHHTLEVLENPSIVDNDTLAHFYMHAGPTGENDRFETESAVRAGLLVERELSARSKCPR